MKSRIKAFLMNTLPARILRYKERGSTSTIYLTFDDGPDPLVTPKVLALLKQFQAEASFFIVGKKIVQFPDMTKAIHEEGHLIANHSYNHIKFTDLDFRSQLEEVESTNKAIYDTLGIKCAIFRPPGGIWSFRLLWALVKKGIVLVNWNRDSLDCRNSTAQKIIKLFMKFPVQGGDIILFHDDDDKVCDILSEMLPYWQKQGFTFSALSSRV